MYIKLNFLKLANKNDDWIWPFSTKNVINLYVFGLKFLNSYQLRFWEKLLSYTANVLENRFATDIVFQIIFANFKFKSLAKL